MVEKNFQNCSHRDDDVTNYDNFLKNCEKWLKYDFFFFFSKIKQETARKKIFKIFF